MLQKTRSRFLYLVLCLALAGGSLAAQDLKKLADSRDYFKLMQATWTAAVATPSIVGKCDILMKSIEYLDALEFTDPDERGLAGNTRFFLLLQLRDLAAGYTGYSNLEKNLDRFDVYNQFLLRHFRDAGFHDLVLEVASGLYSARNRSLEWLQALMDSLWWAELGTLNMRILDSFSWVRESRPADYAQVLLVQAELEANLGNKEKARSDFAKAKTLGLPRTPLSLDIQKRLEAFLASGDGYFRARSD